MTMVYKCCQCSHIAFCRNVAVMEDMKMLEIARNKDAEWRIRRELYSVMYIQSA